MKDKISNIIKNTFEKEYFLDKGSDKTNAKITKQIEEFNENFPDTVSTFLSNLRITLPEAKIENLTQFFNLDRCIRFLVQINEEKRFVCQLSIYGYFSVYKSPCWLKNGKYVYDKKEFINPYENEVCNLLFKCSNVLTKPPIWLDRQTLLTPVFDFSIPKIKYQYQIKIAELLFTEHYV